MKSPRPAAQRLHVCEEIGESEDDVEGGLHCACLLGLCGAQRLRLGVTQLVPGSACRCCGTCVFPGAAVTGTGNG